MNNPEVGHTSRTEVSISLIKHCNRTCQNSCFQHPRLHDGGSTSSTHLLRFLDGGLERGTSQQYSRASGLNRVRQNETIRPRLHVWEVHKPDPLKRCWRELIDGGGAIQEKDIQSTKRRSRRSSRDISSHRFELQVQTAQHISSSPVFVLRGGESGATQHHFQPEHNGQTESNVPSQDRLITAPRTLCTLNARTSARQQVPRGQAKRRHTFVSRWQKLKSDPFSDHKSVVTTHSLARFQVITSKTTLGDEKTTFFFKPLMFLCLSVFFFDVNLKPRWLLFLFTIFPNLTFSSCSSWGRGGTHQDIFLHRRSKSARRSTLRMFVVDKSFYKTRSKSKFRRYFSVCSTSLTITIFWGTFGMSKMQFVVSNQCTMFFNSLRSQDLGLSGTLQCSVKSVDDSMIGGHPHTSAFRLSSCLR